MNIKIILSYDGTHYFGWQKTKAGPSIQGALEEALFKVVRKPTLVEAASRTDRGVHAKGQSAQFILDEKTDLYRLHHALNSVLPPDIRITSLEEASSDFHPTLDATGKEYRYQICQGPVQDPIYRRHSWHVPHLLNLEAMATAAKDLMGTHDFTSFTTINVDDGIRTLFALTITSLPENRLELLLRGDRFLYKMARRIVGTLVMIGKGDLPVPIISSLIKEPNRAMAGVTAPAHGLILRQVFYPNITEKPLELSCSKAEL